MNRYRNYMDRIAAPEELADQVLAGKRSRRPHPGAFGGIFHQIHLTQLLGLLNGRFFAVFPVFANFVFL